MAALAEIPQRSARPSGARGHHIALRWGLAYNSAIIGDKAVRHSIAFLFLWLCLATSAHADSRVALVIGNSAYAGVGALTNPKNDAALVAETLGLEGFKVTLLQDAKHEAMLKALRSFSDEADQADWALVYYAGHGIEVGGVNYLLPVDVELREDRDAEDEAVSLDRVLRAVANAHMLRLVVLDACRNNPFASTMKRSIYTRRRGSGIGACRAASGNPRRLRRRVGAGRRGRRGRPQPVHGRSRPAAGGTRT